MKCLSLMPPWGYLLLTVKDVENRTWRSDFRGPCLIHHSKTWDSHALAVIRRIDPSIIENPEWDSANGMIIGKVTFTICKYRFPDENANLYSKWHIPGQYGYVRTNPVIFDKPIPYRGRPFFFDVPDEIMPAEYRR
ncbi:MAG: hypothetical protein V1742_09140 [Pseudomonadota bacterium]